MKEEVILTMDSSEEEIVVDMINELSKYKNNEPTNPNKVAYIKGTISTIMGFGVTLLINAISVIMFLVVSVYNILNFGIGQYMEFFNDVVVMGISLSDFLWVILVSHIITMILRTTAIRRLHIYKERRLQE